MTNFLNRCSFAPTAGGTADFVVSSAAAGAYTPAQCTNPTVLDGATYHYFAVTSDNSQHEEGDGVYTAATATLTRATIRNSSNSGSKVNFSVAPTVTMGGPIATDIGGVLTGSLSLFVRTAPTTITLSNASPCNASWTSHGLQVNDPVVFSSPYDRGSCTITIASPAVITFNSHGYATNDPISFDTTGALPTGLAINTIYFVTAPTSNTFEVASVASGSAMSTSGSQSGTQYAWRNNTIPSGVTDGAIYFVKTVVDANTFTFSKTAGGSAINTTTSQVGKIVGQTGNDSNSGVAATRTGALLTVGAAWAQICGYDNLNHQTVTVNCAHGTYLGGGFTANTSADTDNSSVFCSDPLSAAVPVKWVGTGSVTFLGDATFPDAVRWVSPAAGNSGQGAEIDVNAAINGTLTFKGLRLEYSGTFNGAGADVYVPFGFSTVLLDTINFGNIYGSVAGTGFKMDVKGGTLQLKHSCQVLATPYTNGAIAMAEGYGTWFDNSSSAGPIIGVNNPPLAYIYQAIDQGFVKAQLPVFQGNWNYSNIAFVDSQGFVYNHLGVGGQNPQPLSPNGAVINDHGFYFEFQSPTSQTAAQFGAPGTPCDIFYLTFSPSAPFTQALNNSHGHIIINPTSTMSSGTITMSSVPSQGQIVNIRTSQAITTMNFSSVSTQSIVGAPTTLTVGQKVEAIYVPSVTTWYFSN